MQNITAEKYFGFPITVKRLVEGYARNEETGNPLFRWEVESSPVLPKRICLLDGR